MNKTFSAKSEEIRREWHVIDAENMCLGRLSSEIAKILMGKNKPIYTPHVDAGDFVIIINADKVKVTGRKNNDKLYYRHTGYIGGIKSANFNWMLQNKPTEIIMLAVKGMLPKNSLGRTMLRKLKVFAGNKHTHSAQQPKVLAL